MEKLIFIAILIFILKFGFVNGVVIGREGDYIFSFLSDLVYKQNDTLPVNQYLNFNGECIEYELVVNVNGMIIYKSSLRNILIVSFKGTSGFGDLMIDLDFNPNNCTISKSLGCGKIHHGFIKEYYKIYDSLLSTIKSLDQNYDVYFCGHSKGSAIAEIAGLDYTINHFNEHKYILSFTVVTFGGPPIGNDEYNLFFKSHGSSLTYRRYVNVNGHTNDHDPISELLFKHPTNPIFLYCKKSCCPLFQLGLHLLDLYMKNLYNENYSECGTNCNFIQKKAKFNTFIQIHCKIKSTSIISGSLSQHSFIPDTYSVCLFKSRDIYSEYKFKHGKSCNLKGSSFKTFNSKYSEITLIDKTSSSKSFEVNVYGSEGYLIIENHNTIFPISSFFYNISFSNPITQLAPPKNLTCNITNINNITNTFDINVSFFSDIDINTRIVPDKSYILYNVYISSFNKNWVNYEFPYPYQNKFISKKISNITIGTYSIVVTSDNGIESKKSNIAYINYT